MSDLAKLRIWDDPAIRGALSWYLDVAENRRPAKFRIAATVATQLDPAASSEGALWAELGYIEGRTVETEYVYADGQFDRLPGLTAKLVEHKVDIIVTASTPASLAAKQGITTIP